MSAFICPSFAPKFATPHDDCMVIQHQTVGVCFMKSVTVACNLALLCEHDCTFSQSPYQISYGACGRARVRSDPRAPRSALLECSTSQVQQMLISVLFRLLHHKQEWQYFGQHAMLTCMQHVVNRVAQCWTDWKDWSNDEARPNPFGAVQSPMLQLRVYIKMMGR